MTIKKRTYEEIARVLFDKDSGEILVGNDITYDGEIRIDQHIQIDSDSIWNIDLSIDGDVMFVYIFEDNGDGTHSAIKPDEVQIVSKKRIQVYFNTDVAGYANVVIASDPVISII